MAEIIRRKLAYGAGALGIVAIVFALTMGLSFGKFGDSSKERQVRGTESPDHSSPSGSGAIK